MQNQINRGNGVANDNLAFLGDLLIENHKKLVEVGKEVTGIKSIIQTIDKKNTPREEKSFWLLVTSVVLALITIIIAIVYSH